MVRETRHLWVGNLPENIREDRIREHFKRYGRVQSVKLLARGSCKESISGGSSDGSGGSCGSSSSTGGGGSGSNGSGSGGGTGNVGSGTGTGGGGTSGLSCTVAFMDIKSASKAHTAEHKIDDRILTTEYYEPAAIPSAAAGPQTSSPAGVVYTPAPTTTRFPNNHGSGEEHASFTERFYERGSSRLGEAEYLRRPGYHEAGGRGRARDRLYRGTAGGPYATLIDRRGWTYEPTSSSSSASRYAGSAPTASDVVVYPVSVETSATSVVERRQEVCIKKKTKSRSGSESPSGSTSSRSPSRSRSTSPSTSSATGTSSRASSSPACSPPSAPRRSNPPVHSEDRRPLAICVRNLPSRSSDTSLKDGLFHEYKKHGKVTWVKVVGQSSDRYALVCFKKPEDVEKALEVSYDKLFFGCKIEVAPYQGYDVEDNEFRPYEAELDEFHPKATRTLFVGNLEKDVTAGELRKHFEQFGEIIEIDVKKQGAVSSYAFCQYADIASVVKAMRTMDGEHLGNNRIKLGFGKSMPTNCVWVDGVSDSVSDKHLSAQFHQYGTVTQVSVDRERGHALIFFDQITCAQAAVKEMRGVALRGRSDGRKLQVDFASRECQEAFYEHLEKQGGSGGGGVDRSAFETTRDVAPRSFETASVTSSTRFRYDTPTRARTSSYSRSSVSSSQCVSAIPSPSSAGSRVRTARYSDYYESGSEYTTDRRFRSYDEFSQGSADDVYEHDSYLNDTPTLQSVVVAAEPPSPSVPFAPPDIRHLQKERVHLLEQLEECPSSGDEHISPKKRLKIEVTMIDGSMGVESVDMNHKSEVRRLSDSRLSEGGRHSHVSRRPSTDSCRQFVNCYTSHGTCKRRKMSGSLHHEVSGSDSVDGSRPGTPLCDERPENLVPCEPRRMRERNTHEGPLSLPLPKFAAQFRLGAGFKSAVVTSPPPVVTPLPPPSPVHVPPPASPPPRPPSLSSSSSDSDIAPTTDLLEERIRSLDEKYEKWSGSRTLSASGGDALAKLDASISEKFRFRHKLLDIDLKEVQPSEIVKSVMAKRSVFDEDSKRLENFGEKYEPREFVQFPRASTNSLIGSVGTAVPPSPLQSPYSSPGATTLKSLPGASPKLPPAKGLQYPFPSHPPAMPATPTTPGTPGVPASPLGLSVSGAATTCTVIPSSESRSSRNKQSVSASGASATNDRTIKTIPNRTAGCTNMLPISSTSATLMSTCITKSKFSDNNELKCNIPPSISTSENNTDVSVSAVNSVVTVAAATVNSVNVSEPLVNHKNPPKIDKVASSRKDDKLVKTEKASGRKDVASASTNSAASLKKDRKSSSKFDKDSSDCDVKKDIAKSSDVECDRKRDSEMYDKKLEEEKRREQERVEERKRKDKEEAERREREENERLEKERLEKERIEKEKLEKERIEKERLEKEKLEKEKQERERLERERRREREEKERREREEQERREREMKEKREKEEQLERERLERERKRKEEEQREKEKLERERLEKERQEKLENERLEKLEKERLERQEREKQLKEKQEKEKRETVEEKPEKHERVERKHKEDSYEHRKDSHRHKENHISDEVNSKNRHRDNYTDNSKIIDRHKDSVPSESRNSHDSSYKEIKEQDNTRSKDNHEIKHGELSRKDLHEKNKDHESSKNNFEITRNNHERREDKHNHSNSQDSKNRHHTDKDESQVRHGNNKKEKENREFNTHDKKYESSKHGDTVSRHLSLEHDKRQLTDHSTVSPTSQSEPSKEKRKDRINSSPAIIGLKRRLSSQDCSVALEDVKRQKFSSDHKKVSDRRDSKDSTRSAGDRPKHNKHNKNNFVKTLEKVKEECKKNKDVPEERKKSEKDKDKDSSSKTKSKQQQKCDKYKSRNKSREENSSQESINVPKTPASAKEQTLVDKDFLANFDLGRVNNDEEKQKQNRKEKKTKQVSIESDDRKSSTEESNKHEEKKKDRTAERKNSRDETGQSKSDDKKQKREERRMRKLTNSSDTTDSDEPKKHSIFDIVDDEPAYISMYDKVKARSCKNMQKQEEEKRQEKIKAKFSQLKQSRAKREEKKRSTSWDEDSDSDHDKSDKREKSCNKQSRRGNKMLITSSDDDDSTVRKTKKKRNVYTDSDTDRSRVIKPDHLVESSDESSNLKLKTTPLKGSKSQLPSDTSEDEHLKHRVNKIKAERFSDSEMDLGFADAEDKVEKKYQIKVKEEKVDSCFEDNKYFKKSKNSSKNKTTPEYSDEDTKKIKTEPSNTEVYCANEIKIENKFSDGLSEAELHDNKNIFEKSETRKKHKKKQKRQKNNSIVTDEIKVEDGENTEREENVVEEKVKNPDRKKHNKKDKKREKMKDENGERIKDKSKKSKKLNKLDTGNKPDSASSIKRDEKMQDIFGTFSDDSENGNNKDTDNTEHDNNPLNAFFDKFGGKLQVSLVYGSDSDSISNIESMRSAKVDEKEKQKEESRKRKEKKRKERERILLEENENSVDLAEAGRALEAKIMNEISEICEQFQSPKPIANNVEEKTEPNTEQDIFRFTDGDESQENDKKNADRKEFIKEKKKKRKKSKEEKQSRKEHHHHHHDRNHDKTTTENKKSPEPEVEPEKEKTSEAEKSHLPSPSLPSLIDVPSPLPSVKSPKPTTPKSPATPSESSIASVPINAVKSPSPKVEKKRDKFIPGFGVEIDEKIHENAVKSISDFGSPILDHHHEMPEETKLPEEDSKVDKTSEQTEEKPRALISQEETEDAVAALLGESFGGNESEFDTYNDVESPSNANDTNPTEVTVPEDDEEIGQAVRSLNASDLEAKPETPQSEHDLQIDTDTDEGEENASTRYDQPPRTPDLVDFSQPPKTPDVSSSYYNESPVTKTIVNETPTPDPKLLQTPKTPNIEMKSPIQDIRDTCRKISDWSQKPVVAVEPEKVTKSSEKSEPVVNQTWDSKPKEEQLINKKPEHVVIQTKTEIFNARFSQEKPLSQLPPPLHIPTTMSISQAPVLTQQKPILTTVQPYSAPTVKISDSQVYGKTSVFSPKSPINFGNADLQQKVSSMPPIMTVVSTPKSPLPNAVVKVQPPTTSIHLPISSCPKLTVPSSTNTGLLSPIITSAVPLNRLPVTPVLAPISKAIQPQNIILPQSKTAYSLSSLPKLVPTSQDVQQKSSDASTRVIFSTGIPLHIPYTSTIVAQSKMVAPSAIQLLPKSPQPPALVPSSSPIIPVAPKETPKSVIESPSGIKEINTSLANCVTTQSLQSISSVKIITSTNLPVIQEVPRLKSLSPKPVIGGDVKISSASIIQQTPSIKPSTTENITIPVVTVTEAPVEIKCPSPKPVDKEENKPATLQIEKPESRRSTPSPVIVVPEKDLTQQNSPRLNVVENDESNMTAAVEQAAKELGLQLKKEKEDKTEAAEIKFKEEIKEEKPEKETVPESVNLAEIIHDSVNAKAESESVSVIKETDFHRQDDEKTEDAESGISDMSKENVQLGIDLLENKDDPLDSKEDSDYWSAKEVNIESVIKTVEALCSADELSEGSEVGKDDWFDSETKVSETDLSKTETSESATVAVSTEATADKSNENVGQVSPKQDLPEPECESETYDGPDNSSEEQEISRGGKRTSRLRGLKTQAKSVERVVGVQTRRGRREGAASVSPRRGGRAARGKIDRKSKRDNEPSSDVYEFHDDSDESKDRPRLILTIKSPSANIQNSTTPSAIVKEAPVNPTPPLLQKTDVQSAQEFISPAANTRKSRRLQERDGSRNTVDDVIEDVVRNVVTRSVAAAATQQAAVAGTVVTRRSARQNVGKTTPPEPRKSPRAVRRGKDRRTSDTTDESGEDKPTKKEETATETQVEKTSAPIVSSAIGKEPLKPIVVTTKLPEKDKPVIATTKSETMQATVAVGQPQGLKVTVLRRLKGDLNTEEPQTLIDPVTGLLMVMKESEEGQYIPVSTSAQTVHVVAKPSVAESVVSQPETIKTPIISKAPSISNLSTVTPAVTTTNVVKEVITSSVITACQPVPSQATAPSQTTVPSQAVVPPQAVPPAQAVGPSQAVTSNLHIKPHSLKAHVLSSEAAKVVANQQASVKVKPQVQTTNATTVIPQVAQQHLPPRSQQPPLQTHLPEFISKPNVALSQNLNVNVSLSTVVTSNLSPRPVYSKQALQQNIIAPPQAVKVALVNQQPTTMIPNQMNINNPKQHFLQTANKPQQQVSQQMHHMQPQPTKIMNAPLNPKMHLLNAAANPNPPQIWPQVPGQTIKQVVISKPQQTQVKPPSHTLHPQPQIMTGAVASPPLKQQHMLGQQPIVTGASSGRIMIPGLAPTSTGGKGPMDPPKLDVTLSAGTMLVAHPTVSPQSQAPRGQNMQAGMPISAYEANLHGVSDRPTSYARSHQQSPPPAHQQTSPAPQGESLNHLAPPLPPAHYVPPHVSVMQYLRAQHPYHLPRSPHIGGLEKSGDGQEGEEAPVTSPPLELRRPGSGGTALGGPVPRPGSASGIRPTAVPHSLQSPHDRATDSPQVAQVYMHGTRMPHYGATAGPSGPPGRYYEQPGEPPPAHRAQHTASVSLAAAHQQGPPPMGLSHLSAGLGAAGNLTGAVARNGGQIANAVDSLATQRGLLAATPPHASQVPPQADSLLMLLQRYPIMWQGLLALKNDQAAVQMHFVFGDQRVARDSLPTNSDGSTPPLRIAQRMRLEPTQIEGVARKMQVENEHCVLLALPCGRDHYDVLKQSTNLHNGFINYLKEKQAAGIVNIAAPGSRQAAYVVHIFPTCEFANQNLARIAPDLLHRVADIAHLLIIIATV